MPRPKKFSSNTDYKNDFNKQNYDRCLVYLDKGKKDKIQQHISKTEDKSVNGFIKRAIDETMERDKSGQ